MMMIKSNNVILIEWLPYVLYISTFNSTLDTHQTASKLFIIVSWLIRRVLIALYSTRVSIFRISLLVKRENEEEIKEMNIIKKNEKKVSGTMRNNFCSKRKPFTTKKTSRICCVVFVVFFFNVYKSRICRQQKRLSYQ
jgi:hypothetical protein